MKLLELLLGGTIAALAVLGFLLVLGCATFGREFLELLLEVLG
jgi:hypothetical protein